MLYTIDSSQIDWLERFGKYLMKNNRKKGRGMTLRQYLHDEMKDSEYRRLYEEADIEMRVAIEIIKARFQSHVLGRQQLKIYEAPVLWEHHADSKVRLIRDICHSLKSLIIMRINSRKGLYR